MFDRLTEDQSRHIIQPTSPRRVHSPAILSRFKSFTTIYRPIVIQPHLNQTIWLLCPFTIASLALQYRCSPLTNNTLRDPLSALLMFLSPVNPPVTFEMAPTVMVGSASTTELYFRSMLTVGNV